jgi:hypothetical protein
MRRVFIRSFWGALVSSPFLVAACSNGSSIQSGSVWLTTTDASNTPDSDAAPPPNQPYGGSWQKLAQPPPFYPDETVLLTDGTLMVHASSLSDWWRLTPDVMGSYANGTWSTLATMPLAYAPTYFGLAVLASGSVVAVGGEYNHGADAWTGLGAIYDPVVDAWTPLLPPASWANASFGIGDTPTVILPNGVFMMGSVGTKNQALLDPRTLTFTLTGTGKYDSNEEEGWTLLPNGNVLTVDVSGAPNSELYDPTSGSWSSAGSTGVTVADKVSGEVGPAILMPSGAVFAMGATAHNAIYQGGTWTAGPDFPMVDAGQLDIADGPAVLLTNGHVLCAASPGDYNPPATFLEFDGTNLTPTAPTPNAVNDTSYTIFLVPLPSGQIIAFDRSLDVEIFTSNGSPDPSWAPTITTAPTTVARGSTNMISGTQFNGLSQACSYGDDYQCATNYPLVRITNNATGHVFYARTHDHSTMGVATGTAPVFTLFDVAQNVETGASNLVVVANGIPSSPVSVTVQ